MVEHRRFINMTLIRLVIVETIFIVCIPVVVHALIRIHFLINNIELRALA